jgi:hypothetical protein
VKTSEFVRFACILTKDTLAGTPLITFEACTGKFRLKIGWALPSGSSFRTANCSING